MNHQRISREIPATTWADEACDDPQLRRGWLLQNLTTSAVLPRELAVTRTLLLQSINVPGNELQRVMFRR
jgi:hypothetical protein